MLRNGPVWLSTLCMLACAPSFAADAPLRTTPPVCAPSTGDGRGGAARGAGWHRRYGWAVQRSVRTEHVWSGGGDGGGVAFGLTQGVGQLGAAGLGYYGVNGCWGYQPVYDRFGNYFGQEPVNICLGLPPN